MGKVYWTMRNGAQIDIDAMSTEHLRNTLKMIVNNSIRVSAQKELERKELHLIGEMAQQIQEQIILEEFDSWEDYEFFSAGL
jgi:hypothetical protein